MECARELAVDHFLMASTSSAYRANEEIPFSEQEKFDTQIPLYAAGILTRDSEWESR